MAEISLKYEGHGAWTLTRGEAVTLALDPARARGRRQQAAPEADFVLVSEATPAILEEALDRLEETQATLIASPEVCDVAARELELPEARLMDLEGWGRARCAHFRITALPLTAAASAGWTRGLPGLDTLRGLPGLSELGAALGQAVGASSTPVLGFLIELEGGPRVLFASAALCGPPDVPLLEAIAELSEVDVLVAGVEGPSVEGLVWAARVLAPETVLLYRRGDPYALGKASQSLPMRRFIDALEEDDPELGVEHLRDGDVWRSEGGA